jgi:uncharacterized protein YdbL (DUF1318 family)
VRGGATAKQPAPVATTEPAKTEPEKTEQTTIEPAKTEPAKTEVATTIPVTETKPTVTPEPEKMQVKSVEPTPTKEEPMTAEKKEAVKSDIESQLLPVTEKTEVKAIETPSDKMVIKSKKKEAEKDEWDCPVGETGCAKNDTEVYKYVEKINKDNNKNYRYIADREGKLASLIDSKDMRGRTIIDFYKTEDYDHNKKGFMFSAEELPKSKRFSTYNIPIEGKETSLIYDNKTGVIMRQTDDAIKTKDGNQMMTWLDVPMNNPEYKELKSIIEGVNYKKEKGAKNTFVAPPTETQFVPDWLKK